MLSWTDTANYDGRVINWLRLKNLQKSHDGRRGIKEVKLKTNHRINRKSQMKKMDSKSCVDGSSLGWESPLGIDLGGLETGWWERGWKLCLALDTPALMLLSAVGGRLTDNPWFFSAMLCCGGITGKVSAMPLEARLGCTWRKRPCWWGAGMESSGHQRSHWIPVFCDSKPNFFWAVVVRGSAECELYTPLFQACWLIWLEGSQVFQQPWLRTTGRVQASFLFFCLENSAFMTKSLNQNV